MKNIFCTLTVCTVLFFCVFTIKAKTPENDMSAYLFTYFIGGAGEDIRYALSNDGYTWYAINNNEPIIDTDKISSSGGVRDPHILRGADGKSFYMVVTDMHTAKNGWTPNTAMVLMSSPDLINWKSTMIDIPKTYPQYVNMGNIWAPQTIYDAKAEKYMVYWSMTPGRVASVFYYAYANKDFTGFESAPQVLFANPNGKSVIDADIIEKDGVFHLFFKTEGESRKGIMKAVSNSLTEGYKMIEEKYLNQTERDVEGSCVFPLIGTNDYILMYDMYRDRKYQFTKSSDLLNFEVIDDDVSMNFGPRHGTVMQITAKEAQRIIAKWGITTDINIAGSHSYKSEN